MRFNHFILTRFNIRLWWHEDKAHHAVQTAEWLDERFRLFENYTWPSVRTQTCSNYHWICLFDEDTDDVHKAIVTRFADADSRFHPVYVNKVEALHFQDIFRREITRLVDYSIDKLLTTYLDSDDALHRRYVEDIQRRAEKLKFGTIISYIYGIQYYESMNLAVRIPYKNNHFLTYYERLNRKNRTVWGFWRFLIFKYKNLHIELIDEKREPMWVEVIHAGNVDNDVKMTLRHKLLTEPLLLHDYGLDIKLPPKRCCRQLFLTTFVRRFMNQIVRRSKDKLLSKKR
jgi:hypothetical protein